MDVYHSQLDYSIGEMDRKHEKLLAHEDRVDSGVDSLKEDEYNIIAMELKALNMANDACSKDECRMESWKKEVTDDGDTFLHLAIIHEATEHAIHMISQSRNDPFLNAVNNQRQTPLHLAVITEQCNLVERLLKAGCDPRLADDDGNTALHIACKNGSLAIFSVLTQNCSQHLRFILAFPNYNGHNCLHLASIYGFLSMVETLVKLGADVNAPEQCSGRTALHLAVDLQNAILVKQLLSLGADVNCLTYGGHTPYHLTLGRQDENIRHQLFERTPCELRELPSESDDEALSEDEMMYDDIMFAQ